MSTLKNLFGWFVVIGLLFGAACTPKVAENTSTKPANTSGACEGNAVTVDGGSVACDGEYGVFSIPETTTFACTPNGDTLTCDTKNGAVFTVTGAELPTPTPFPTYTEEEMTQIVEETSDENVIHSLTGFYDCGIYSVGVSTWEELGGGEATCGSDNTTFTISLPMATDEVWCARDVYGWSCGTEKQSFWFFLLPTW